MLTLILGTDWTENSNYIMQMITQDVAEKKADRILMVPELISYDTERRLCQQAGDSACRFAEVLSFSRLASRVAESVGHAACRCMDNGGRIVAMAAATRQLHSKLKAYAAVETKPEFLADLVEAVDEFKRCCISSDMLMHAAGQTDGVLAQKLEELALLLSCYDGICSNGLRDPRDQMEWLLDELEVGTYAQEHVFYIDFFPDFTNQHLAIIEHLIRNSPNVTISLNCDCADTRNVSFEKASETAATLIQIANKWNIPLVIQNVEPRGDKLAIVRRSLFWGTAEQKIDNGLLEIYQTETVYQECIAASQKILELVRSGARFRDVCLVFGDRKSYQNTVQLIFERCGIPLYLSGTEGVLEHPVVSSLIAALNAALNGFDQQDMLRYQKSMLSPLRIDESNMLENYVLLWGVDGKNWLSDWKNHPDGLNEQWDEDTSDRLNVLNDVRRSLVSPLEKLSNAFKNAPNLSGQIRALYEFFVDIKLSEQLSTYADMLDKNGDKRQGQILNQIWDILISALEQMHDVLGQTVWDADTFIRLFKLLLSQYDVGTIPPVLDAVIAGPVSAMRCQKAKHLIVLGAQDGVMPSYGASAGVLTEQERGEIRRLGVNLNEGQLYVLKTEFSEIYGVFCGATDTVTVSCSVGQPSFLFNRLSQLVNTERVLNAECGAAVGDPEEIAAFLARWNAKDHAETLGIQDAYERFIIGKNHRLGNVQQDTIQELYGTQLMLSASQIDRLAECRLSYFLKYGLKAQERKKVDIDPAEFGTYVHAVLENTVRDVMELGGFQCVDVEQCVKIAKSHSDAYATERFAQLDVMRVQYLFDRNSKELELIVRELWQELHNSDFLPVAFELAFGKGREMPAVEINGRMMTALLRGVVDRVDLWRGPDGNYFRVVDYKTGRKDFDYCDVFNGIGLQMLLYLFALRKDGATILGDNKIPAGVQYFPARVPVVSADGLLNDETANALRAKEWKRKGLLLHDEGALHAMQKDLSIDRLPCSRKKDGTISGDLADHEQLDQLEKYVFQMLGEMVDDIASGNIAPNPYTRGSSHNACTYCPYYMICHLENVDGRRNYKTMTQQRFWEEINKEVPADG